MPVKIFLPPLGTNINFFTNEQFDKIAVSFLNVATCGSRIYSLRQI